MEAESCRKQTPEVPSKRMCLHPLTLAFRYDQKHLEKKFLDHYFVGSLPIVRVTCFFVLILYAAFGILDAYLIPEKKNIFWVIRYAVFCPFSLGVFAFSFSSLFKKVMQPLVAFWEVLGGIGIIYMILVAPPPITFSYYAGLILVFMMGYTVIKLRFVWATCTGWLLVVLYEVTAVYLVDTPAPVLLNNNFFFISANLIGMFICYVFEYYARRDFFLQVLLEKEQRKVRNARDRLEGRVRQRTLQFEEANTLLKHEMAERLRAEEARKRVQEQLLRHQKMESLGLMAGGVAHDLNNILSGIISYPELLLLELPKDSELRPTAEAIRESGMRAAAVVADLLTVARGIASEHEAVCLNDLVKTYLLSPEYGKMASLHPSISVRTELCVNLQNCKCSSVHIQKVLMNLVNNAFEAIEASGEVVVKTCNQAVISGGGHDEFVKPGEYIKVQVSDSGPGIQPEILQHIFEPFYTKKVMGRSGTGLGLAVVWNTVQEHNGVVTVDSNDRGTTFSVYLPVTAESIIDSDTADQKWANLQGDATILVVDDEAHQRDIGQRVLTRLGYKVVTVDSGESAIAYLKKDGADLVLLDMLMDPGMNGLQTYDEIIKLHPGQKAIIISGFSESDDVKKAMQLGVGRFIKKPFTIEDLGLVVKEVLAAP